MHICQEFSVYTFILRVRS